jgi:hypothetical protein
MQPATTAWTGSTPRICPTEQFSGIQDPEPLRHLVTQGLDDRRERHALRREHGYGFGLIVGYAGQATVLFALDVGEAREP